MQFTIINEIDNKNIRNCVIFFLMLEWCRYESFKYATRYRSPTPQFKKYKLKVLKKALHSIL